MTSWPPLRLVLFFFFSFTGVNHATRSSSFPSFYLFILTFIKKHQHKRESRRPPSDIQGRVEEEKVGKKAQSRERRTLWVVKLRSATTKQKKRVTTFSEKEKKSPIDFVHTVDHSCVFICRCAAVCLLNVHPGIERIWPAKLFRLAAYNTISFAKRTTTERWHCLNRQQHTSPPPPLKSL